MAESATYNPDLTRDVTHLVAVAPTGKKYQFARKHKIPVVLPEWLKDSMERGMALDEDCYNPLLPREKIGVGARPAKAAVQTEVQHFNGKRKIRKATQEKLGGLSQGLWEDIVGQARNIKPAKRNEWEEADVMSDGDEMGQARNVKPTKSHELEVYDMLSPENDVVSPGDCMELHREADKGSEEEGNENNGTGRMDPTIDVASQGPPPPKKAPPPPPKKGGMFANCGFWMWGFGDKQMAALKDAVVPHDGTVLGSLDDLEGASYLSWRLVVVPREKRLAEYPYIPEDYEVTVVTEWWLETCLHHQKFVMPMGDFTTMPIEEFEVDGLFPANGLGEEC